MKPYELDDGLLLQKVFFYTLANQLADRLIIMFRCVKGHHAHARLRGSIPHQLKPFVLSKSIKSEWPCTKLSLTSKEVGLAYVFEFNKEVSDSVLQIQPDLFRWVSLNGGSHGEDICLFSSRTGVPTLVSVTHEREAWILNERLASKLNLKVSELNYHDLLIPNLTTW